LENNKQFQTALKEIEKYKKLSTLLQSQKRLDAEKIAKYEPS
jgi:hypothetical protein